VQAFARIGNAFAKQNNFEGAIEAYESSLVESHTEEVYDKLKKIRVAKRKAEEEAYLDPAKAEEAKQRGNELFKAGKFTESVVEYSEAIKRKPTDAVYYCNRATARTKIMDFNGAYDDCLAAIKLNPKYAKAHVRKGAIEFLRKEYHKVKCRPRWQWLLIGSLLAEGVMMVMVVGQAMESYRAALAVEPENDEAREGLERTVLKIQTEVCSSLCWVSRVAAVVWVGLVDTLSPGARTVTF
jgi:tetratricopeptide (TPR) repeat protein